MSLTTIKGYRRVKTYREYLELSKEANKRIMAKYGAPRGAKPPTNKLDMYI